MARRVWLAKLLAEFLADAGPFREQLVGAPLRQDADALLADVGPRLDALVQLQEIMQVDWIVLVVFQRRRQFRDAPINENGAVRVFRRIRSGNDIVRRVDAGRPGRWLQRWRGRRPASSRRRTATLTPDFRACLETV